MARTRRKGNKNKFELNVQGISVWYAKVNAAPGFLITQAKPEESSYRFVQTKTYELLIISLY